MATDFTLPELGENIAAGDVLRVLVKPGDTIAKDQPVLELETDKATIEVPSSVAGKVKDIKVKAGEKVKVGQAILSVDDGAATNTAAPAAKASAAQPPAEKAAASPQQPDRQVAKAEQPEAVAPKPVEAKQEPAKTESKVVDINRGARAPAETPAASAAPEMPPAPAAPSVRRVARELGVDINQVAGSGEAGR